MLPLEGITVVSLEHAVAAPFCTRQLADYGARVIKIERPGDGDFARAYDQKVKGLASYFVWLNRGKESVTLDLKQPAAREALERLLARADVLVQNLAPGATQRMGLDFETLAPKYPRLVVADISGYGDTGPERERKAYDLLIQAEAGLLSITGTPDTPSRCGLSISDVSAGMYAYTGVLLGLLERQRTGKGTRVELSMLEAVVEWMGQPLYFGHYGGKPQPRSGATHPSVAPYGPHRAGDGREVIFGLQNEREWKKLCAEVLGQPELAEDPRFRSNVDRVHHREALTAVIEERFARMTAEEVVALLERAGIATGRLNGIEDVWAHPQLAGRQRWRTVGTSAGEISALLPPVNLRGNEAAMGDVPAVGQHTGAVLEWLGYRAGEIEAMRAHGAI
ncbi:MAG TPA: CaiB/BaiF CoA-transferase family protein [Myxococcaceae bacterium]|jgi:crotonobetainyl-CoA:carnitine CoA-transferase CaiB-like acyl-CoA transferase|nr:CaiB/BaiF CoA-transferase family protein [Myxococcaceae bacterium]